MQQLDIMMKLVNQILILTLLGFVGFIAGRTKYLPENTSKIISTFIMKITMPLLLVTTIASHNFTYKTIVDGIWVFVLGFVFLLFAGMIGWLMGGKLKLEPPTRNVYASISMFGNVIFLAYPLLNVIFGEKGIVYAIFFNLASDGLLWTLGVYLLNKHKTNEWKENLKHLINANTISFVVGIIIMIVNFNFNFGSDSFVSNFSQLLYDAFHPLGGTTIYLSMIFIGLILSQVRFQKASDILKRYPVFILSIFRLLIIPAMVFGILYLTGDFFDPFVKKIIVLQLAMPCGTIVTALAAQHDSDYKFATEGVFITTIASIITLPAIVYFLQVFL